MLTWYLSGEMNRHICQFVLRTEMDFVLLLEEVQQYTGAIMLIDSKIFIVNLWVIQWFHQAELLVALPQVLETEVLNFKAYLIPHGRQLSFFWFLGNIFKNIFFSMRSNCSFFWTCLFAIWYALCYISAMSSAPWCQLSRSLFKLIIY